MAHEVRPGEIVIEIDTEIVSRYERPMVDSLTGFDPHNVTIDVNEVVAGNSNHIFFPTEDVLRGRIHMSRFDTKGWYDLDKATNEIPELPGQRVHIDIEKKIGRITDGLGAPENKEIYNKARKAGHLMQGQRGWLQLRPEVEKKFKDNFALWGWIYAMRQIVDEGCAMPDGNKPVPRTCRPIQGVDLLPSMDDCIKSGFARPHWAHRGLQAIAHEDRIKYEPGYKDNPQPGILTPALMAMATD